MTYGWAILVLLIVGVILWKLGLFSSGENTTVVSTGFARVKPQSSTLRLSSAGDFNCAFINGAGGTITVYDVIVNNTDRKVTCQPVTSASPVSVPAGENFQAQASGCGTDKAGEVYHLDVTINYSITRGSSETFHTDFGVIRGPYEA
ncbi:Uncharacterised protein [uncultured archaeon]|nr:Uncharacterised protein [uncultured archaeon]